MGEGAGRGPGTRRTEPGPVFGRGAGMDICECGNMEEWMPRCEIEAAFLRCPGGRPERGPGPHLEVRVRTHQTDHVTSKNAGTDITN